MSKKSGISVTSIFFFVAAIACTVVRYLQYSSVIKTEDGFFAYDGGFLNEAYYFFVAGAAVLFLFTALLDAKLGRGIRSQYKPAPKKPKNKQKKASKTSETLFLPEETRPGVVIRVFSAVAIIGAIVFAAAGFFSGLAVAAVFEDVFSGGLPVFNLILPIVAALSYTFVAYTVLVRRKLPPVTAIAMLLIAASCAGVAATEFMERTYILNLSARLVFLVTFLFLAVFFLSCGRIIVKSESRGTAVFATVSGFMSALLIISDGVARLIHYYSINGEIQHDLMRHNNGFELPTLQFFLQGGGVLWLLFALSSRAAYSEVEVAKELNDTGDVHVISQKEQEEQMYEGSE
ncbi:MAG: hypothetical protein FWG83_02400 [Oscillospiraceae bacterium]|nr:hypothetical protein [Oscillospiraceae bacterium]